MVQCKHVLPASVTRQIASEYNPLIACSATIMQLPDTTHKIIHTREIHSNSEYFINQWPIPDYADTVFIRKTKFIDHLYITP